MRDLVVVDEDKHLKVRAAVFSLRSPPPSGIASTDIRCLDRYMSLIDKFKEKRSPGYFKVCSQKSRDNETRCGCSSSLVCALVVNYCIVLLQAGERGEKMKEENSINHRAE